MHCSAGKKALIKNAKHIAERLAHLHVERFRWGHEIGFCHKMWQAINKAREQKKEGACHLRYRLRSVRSCYGNVKLLTCLYPMQRILHYNNDSTREIKMFDSETLVMLWKLQNYPARACSPFAGDRREQRRLHFTQERLIES